jgi:hypothetical protein
MRENNEIKKIEETLENHEKRITILEKTLSETKPKMTTKKISIKEFILQKQPKNDILRTLAIGYYLEKNGGLASFNGKDIEKGFRDAREKVPLNVPDKIQKNIAKGHMMEAEEEKDGLKAYVLTNLGEKFVENDFKE